MYAQRIKSGVGRKNWAEEKWVVQKKSRKKSGSGFVNFRPGPVGGNRLQNFRNDKAAQVIQKKGTGKGLPENLKAGIESLSGYSMDDVNVHYNSPGPAQLHAHAYTRGTEIHIAPGQEKHLPHESWHVVQQMEGRVKPTAQMKGERINDEVGLEYEADRMGEKAARMQVREPYAVSQGMSGDVQGQGFVQQRPIPGNGFGSQGMGQHQSPLQLKVSLNGEYFVKRLGGGTFGNAYETSHGNVAKINRDGKGGKDEYDMLKRIYDAQSAGNNVAVVKPIFHGKVVKNTQEPPHDFDARIDDKDQGILMEKVNRLVFTDNLKDIMARFPTDEEIHRICEEELETFAEMMALRRSFMESGYEHGDIKHINVGRDKTGKLKAFDVGLAKEYDPARQPLARHAAFINNWQSNDDFYKSYRFTLEMITRRLGVPAEALNEIISKGTNALPIVPHELLETIKKVRWFDPQKTSEQDSLKELTGPTKDWIYDVLKKWWASARLKNPTQDWAEDGYEIKKNYEIDF